MLKWYFKIYIDLKHGNFFFSFNNVSNRCTIFRRIFKLFLLVTIQSEYIEAAFYAKKVSSKNLKSSYFHDRSNKWTNAHFLLLLKNFFFFKLHIWCVLTVRNLPLFRCHKIIWLQWFSCQQNNVTSWLPYQAGKGITRSATITAVVCLEQDSLIVLIKTSFKLSFLSLCSYIIHCACTERYNS